MPERARVTSIDALEAFRSSLILYLEKAGRALDEVSDEVVRTRLWLQNDRRLHWEGEVRRRARLLEHRQAELFSAKMSSLRDARQEEELAVREARRGLQEAEEHLALVKKWNRQYDSQVEAPARDVEKLRNYFIYDLGKALTSLTQTISTLAEYASVAPPSESPPPAPSSPAEAPAAPASPARETGVP